MYRLVGILLLVACRNENDVQPKPPDKGPGGDPTTETPTVPPSEHDVVINEVMAGNQSTVNGPDGTSFPDWIELVNVGETTVPLSELSLRNSDGARWTGPEGQDLAPGDRVIIFASDEEIGDGLVANITLDKNGDKLSLLGPGDEVFDFLDIEEVSTDISYARTPDSTGELVQTAWPTPGSVNPETASPTLNPADETLFVPYVMHRIDFTFTPESYNNINRSQRPEVHVEADIDGVHYADVGLKLKGSASYQTMEGKPAFILDFNEWVEGTKFRDLKAIKLHNGLVLDPTRSRDFLSYKLARTAGLMAPRVGWAEVYCNGEYYGLYMMIEKHDDVFIDYRKPGQQDLGVVFEPNEAEQGWGWGDFGSGNVGDWNMEEGPVPPDPGTIESLESADAIIAGAATDERVAQLWNYMDKQQVLTYFAWETLIMHTDGYRAPNNWRVFVDGETHMVQLVPSGAEWTWDFDVDTFGWYGGRAGAFCLANEGCSRDYAERVLELADMVEDLGLRTEYTDLQTWLNPYIQSDPRYGTTWQSLPQARESTGRHLDENPGRARQQVYQRFPELQP